MSNLVYLSLGSNLGDRQSHLHEAIRRLKLLGSVLRISSLYETEPVELIDQPWFLNCAVALETSSTPVQLMQQLLEIEEGMGRQRVQKKGPRIIDIDILLFGEEVVKTPEVTIPHPAMHQRRFVLVSMAQIARTATHPVLKKTIQQLLHELPKGQIVKRFEGEFAIDLTDPHGPDSTK